MVSEAGRRGRLLLRGTQGLWAPGGCYHAQHLRANEGKFQNDTNLDAGYYPGRVVITPLDENSVSVRALQAKMNGGTVEDFDPLNYKLLESDLSLLDECLQAPYDDLGIENWKTEPTGFGRLYSLLMGSG